LSTRSNSFLISYKRTTTKDNIDLNVKVKQRRRKISTKCKDSLVTSSIGEREEINNESKYRTSAFYP
jgi:hypothetical protein